VKATKRKTVYLTERDLSDICFLDEVLYWVAFQRLPFFWTDFDGVAMPDYEVEFALNRLAEDECERAGLPHDPRISFDWALRVKCDDSLETIIAEAEAQMVAQDDAMTDSFDNSAAPREASGDPLFGRSATSMPETHEEAVKLHNELKSWCPQYRKAIELPTAKVYVALKEGTLSAKGKLLPDLDPKKALNALAKEGRDLADARDVEIPREFWSLRKIFWEKSAARNEDQHYCQIYCQTEDVLSVFPLESLIQGVQVSGLERFGSLFVLNDPALAITRPTTLRSRKGGTGRPAKYSWDVFHLEVASIVEQHKLPEKKEAAIEHFRKWFFDCFGKSPSRTMIGDRLTPYYQRFVKNAGRKISSGITA
jgi:hypothetical protein